MADRQTKVSLRVQMEQYQEGMRKAAQATRETGTEMEKLAQQREAFTTIGAAAVAAGTVMVGATALAARAAIEWESAWAGVTKTVEGTPDELAAVEDGLRGLTAVLPAAHDEIAAVAEAAGQLGIATPNVVEFTRTMIDLGETTNLSASDAATALARFTNIMGTSQSQVSNLGSAIVDLGNNYATTEGEIVDMAMRLAGAGRQIGLTEGEVLGLATSLSSVGIEAEAGGSAVSKVMIDIAASVDSGGERLEMFAKVAGVSASEFSRQWRTEPGEALAAFVSGLANAEAQGQTTLGILEDLGITEVRMRDALLRSSAAADQFSEAMSTGNEAFAENTALQDEAAKRYETTEAKIQIMVNAVNDAAISFGEVLLPVVGAAAEKVTEFSQFMGDLPGPVQGATTMLTGLAGAVSLGAGAWFLAAPKIAAYNEAIAVLGPTAQRASRGLGALARAGGAALVLGASVMIVNDLAKAFTDSIGPSAEETANKVATAASAFDLLNAALQSRDLVNSTGEASRQVREMGDALDEAASKSGQWWTQLSSPSQATVDNLRAVGRELATLAAADLPAAQAQFRRLAEDSGLSAEQQAQLIQEMPALRDELTKQATAAGMAADDQTLLKFAMGDASSAADEQVVALEELQGVAVNVQTDVNALADSIRNFGSLSFDTEQATIAFYDSLQSLDDALAEGAGSLDVTTEAGRNTLKAMLDVAGSTNDYAASVAAMGGSTEEVQGILENGRQKIIDTRIALGDSEQAAREYADQLIATPETIQTQVQLNGVAAARAALQGILNYDGTTVNINATLSPNRINPFGEIPGNAEGGAIYGPGGPKDDMVLRRLSAGEHVLTADDVARMGGQHAVYSFRQGLHSGGAQAQAVPSIDGASITGTLQIGGDGLARIIDGRISTHDANATRVARGRRQVI